MIKTQKILWERFSKKHRDYIKAWKHARMMVAEGAIRAGKTIDNCIIAAMYLEVCKDRIHLASGSTLGNAKLNIGECNGFGLAHLFRGRCRWGKYLDNDAMFINTQTGEKIVIFVGGGLSNSYRRILGNSYGLWIATEANEHYDSDDSKESFIKVAFGRQLAAQRPLTLWDLNPCSPQHRIYTDYIDKYKDTMPGYVYEHFTIADNLSVTEERRAEILAQYDQNSVWYRRDILGERCVAEGLCYPLFADTPERYIIDILTISDIIKRDGCGREEAERLCKRQIPDLSMVIVGVDFGGSGSGHAFEAVGITSDYAQVITLDEYYHDNHKKKLDPHELEQAFVDFIKGIKEKFGFSVYQVYADSAEQTLIAGLKSAALTAGLAMTISNALKAPITDRIRFYNRLMASNRFKVARHCTKLIEALRDAHYDAKKTTEDVRLDNGSTNIDSLDALEYTTERLQKNIIAIGG